MREAMCFEPYGFKRYFLNAMEEVMQHVYELFQDGGNQKFSTTQTFPMKDLLWRLVQIESIISWELLSNASFPFRRQPSIQNPVHDVFWLTPIPS